jgi:hypothetical protein
MSEGMIRAGVFGVPSSLRRFLEGEYTLLTPDGAQLGKLVAKENSGWGLGPLFTRRGRQPARSLACCPTGESRLQFPRNGSEHPLLHHICTNKCVIKGQPAILVSSVGESRNPDNGVLLEVGRRLWNNAISG